MTTAKTPKSAKEKGGSSGPERSSDELSHGALRVLFLARREEITALIEAGHFQRSAYDQVFPNGGLSFSLFSRYVRRYIKKEESHDRSQKPAAPKPQPPISNAQSNAGQPVKASAPKIPGTIPQFNFKLGPDDIK